MSESPKRWRVNGIIRELGEAPDVVADRAAQALGVLATDVAEWEVVRRSIDARGRRAPRFEISVEATLHEGVVPTVTTGPRVSPASTFRPPPPPTLRSTLQPVVIGMGPCGLFAALRLAAAGLKPIVLDRGKPVETRARDVSRLMGRGELNEESNLCYGEGGAGTWSDGKLYTRVGGAHLQEVLEIIVQHGGPEDILVNARPHLGTDRLVAILKSLRKTLTDMGADLRFETRVERLLIRDGVLQGVELAGGDTIDTPFVVLAPGHSARELYAQLLEDGVALQLKPFAVGFRVEHPQALINEAQYGAPWADHPELPPAYYELKAAAGGRTTYSFCMCPGGSVVPTPTRDGEVCVNGMSHAARSGHFANSALIVPVSEEDLRRYGGEGPEILAGVRFQEAAEQAAWQAGGGEFRAPAQSLTDFLADRPSQDLRRTTYRRGIRPTTLRGLYPDAITDALQAGIGALDHKLRGFHTDEAILIGVETRTSAPLTVLRHPERLDSLNTVGLYPSGEGAGYGGGIVSAAIDGIRSADAILQRISEGI